MRKKIFAAVIAAAMTMAMMPTLASTAETEDFYQENSVDEGHAIVTSPETEEVIWEDNYIPTEVWNIATNGQMNFAGEANGTAKLYTSYLFTGVSSAVVHVNNQRSTSTTATIYRRYTLFGQEFSSYVGEFTIPGNTTKIQMFNLNASHRYYIGFSSPCKFDGYVF